MLRERWPLATLYFHYRSEGNAFLLKVDDPLVVTQVECGLPRLNYFDYRFLTHAKPGHANDVHVA
jgi:hypothetical protein